MKPLINNIGIHIDGDNIDDFEVSPFPIPPISFDDYKMVYIRMKKKKDALGNGFLICGKFFLHIKVNF